MKFLRNCWYVAGHAEEVTGKPFSRVLLGEPVVIFRTESGILIALDNTCPHRAAPLHMGKVCGEELQCPYHGLRFDRAGDCVGAPATGEPLPRAKLKSYAIVERYGMLWIWMGEASLADPTNIPDFSRLEAADATWWTGCLYARGNYQLVVDNLLDLSHVEFIHPLLATDGWAGRNRQNIEQDGDTVTVRNVAPDDPILPMARAMNPKLAPMGTSVQTLRWSPPSVLQLEIEYRSETGDWLVPSGHFLTPETALTTHYFLRAGQTIDPENAAMTAQMREATLALFQKEDIAMIEAQQVNLGTRDLMDINPASLRADAGAMRARRVLAKRIKDEEERALPRSTRSDDPRLTIEKHTSETRGPLPKKAKS